MSQVLTTAASATTGNGLLTNNPPTISTQSTYPIDQGGTLSWGSNMGTNASGVQSAFQTAGISTTELNYKNRLTTSSTITNDGGDLYSDFQNFIALWCRSGTAAASTCGLSQLVTGGIGTAQGGNGASYAPSIQMTPRAVIFRIQQMCNTMLANPNVG